MRSVRWEKKTKKAWEEWQVMANRKWTCKTFLYESKRMTIKRNETKERSNGKEPEVNDEWLAVDMTKVMRRCVTCEWTIESTPNKYEWALESFVAMTKAGACWQNMSGHRNHSYEGRTKKHQQQEIDKRKWACASQVNRTTMFDNSRLEIEQFKKNYYFN